MAANTPIAGCSGTVTLAGRGGRFVSWAGQLIHEVYDASGYSSAGYRQNVGGVKSMVVTADAILTLGSTSDTPNWTALSCGDLGTTCTFQATTGCTYVGLFNVSNIRINSQYDNVAHISFDCVANGVVAETWTTT